LLCAVTRIADYPAGVTRNFGAAKSSAVARNYLGVAANLI
jgi:hypothetical protein